MFIKVGLSPHVYVRQFIFEHLLGPAWNPAWNLMIQLT